MTTTFVGAFNPITNLMSDSSSGAGAKVQYQIIQSIFADTPDLKTIVMQEYRTWPFSDFYIKRKRDGCINFLPMVNFFLTKKLFFAFRVFIELIVSSPSKVYFYNTNAYLNFFMWLLSFIRKKHIKILIIQDFNVPRKITSSDIFRLNLVFSYFFAKLTKYSFNYFVPITQQLGDHLGFPSNRSYPFLGAVLDGYNREQIDKSTNIAVFAGALEPYNGVDYFLEAWSKLDNPIELHIFGSGTLVELVSSFANDNNRIIYHGFQSPNIVKGYIERAAVNFCFRYSRGIEQEFFFPSKFFDVVANSGIVVCNRFINIPKELEHTIYFVEDDFSNLNFIMHNLISKPSFFEQRIKILSNAFSWSYIIRIINQVTGATK